MVSPPNVLSVADKNIKLHPVVNVTGIVISSNDKGGLYLPPDDRRHFVAWSECKPSDLVHKLGRSGYSPVRNEAEKEGRWKVAGKHVMVYGRKDVSMRVRLDAARKLINEMFVSDAEEQRKARAARKLKPAA
jgi:hypothetical protein